MRILIILFLCFFTIGLNCQDINYAKLVIDTLASPYFKGRGYTSDGLLNAANYIANELKSNNIKPLRKKSYFQTFKISVNSITSVKDLEIDELKLKPAHDFIIWPNSPSISGKYELFYLTQENSNDLFLKDLSRTFIVLDSTLKNDENSKLFAELIQYTNPFRAKGVISLENKLTQVHRSYYQSWSYIEILSNKYPIGSDSLSIDITTEFTKNYKANNVCAIINGKSDSIIILSAHYDHVGEFGDEYFPGANDNASGVSFLLDFAKKYSDKKPKNTIVLLFSASEEIGLLGSDYFVNSNIIDFNKVKMAINLDMIGTGDDGIAVVNAKTFEREYSIFSKINTEYGFFDNILERGESYSSDHYSFHKKNIKNFFIYTKGGSQAYHDVNDKAEALSLIAYENLFKLIEKFIDKL